MLLRLGAAQNQVIDLSQLTIALLDGQRLGSLFTEAVNAKRLLQRPSIALLGLRDPLPMLADPVPRDPGMATRVGLAQPLPHLATELRWIEQQVFVSKRLGLGQRLKLSAMLKKGKFLLDLLGTVAIQRHAPGPRSVVVRNCSDAVHVHQFLVMTPCSVQRRRFIHRFLGQGDAPGPAAFLDGL